MHRYCSILVLASLAGTLAFAQASTPQVHLTRAKSTAHKQKPSAAKKGMAEPLPQPTAQQPVVPLRPEQLPSVPPKVSYNNGELTVVAENSSMADIIGAIRNATGLKIETQGGAGGERVAARIGPAPVRDVLVSLFDGSRFDYIILGSATNPAAVERVILTQRTGGPANPSSVAAAQPRPTPQQQVPPDSAAEGDDDNAEGFSEPAPMPPQNGQIQNGQAPTDNAQQQNGAQQNNGTIQQSQPQPPQDQQNVKTPEQLMQELRQMEMNRANQNPDVNARPDRGDRPK